MQHNNIIPEVSICIPAYKNTQFLKRLLNSLLSQTYKHFEVIISDDSPGDEVKNFVQDYQSQLNIIYFKNTPSLGTPANWNAAMKQAKGRYIKLIHDDDWLATVDALELMVNALDTNPQASFVFTAYNNVNVETNTIETVKASSAFLSFLKKEPLHLFRENAIGPPSVIMHRRECDFDYDENLKWVVDFEAYTRLLQKGNQFVYIDKPLINVGISSLQVTKVSSRIREVEIPENLYMLEKLGIAILKKIWVYDYYWRLLRNVSIRSEDEIVAAGWSKPIPLPIKQMLRLQKKFPLSWLRVGAFSKTLMLYSFATSKNTL